MVRWISLGSGSLAESVSAELGMGEDPGGTTSPAYGGSAKSVKGNGKLGYTKVPKCNGGKLGNMGLGGGGGECKNPCDPGGTWND